MISQSELDALKGYCDIVALAESFGCQPQREGRRFRSCCLWHEERTGSLVLYPEQGTYHCYGCGAHGDQAKMVQERLGTDFLGSLRHLAQWSGYWPQGLTDASGQVRAKAVPPARPAARVKEDKRRLWHVVTPVPAKVPEPHAGTFETYLHTAERTVRPTAVWAYRDARGQILGCDVRYDFQKQPKDNAYRQGDAIILDGHRGEVAELLDGGAWLRLLDGRTVSAAQARLLCKTVPTWTWCRRISDGEQQWRMRSWDDPSPLYGLDRLAARPGEMVLLVEGCKTADAAERRTGCVAVTWRGGSSAAEKRGRIDWSPLAGRDVTIWPDADEPGRRAAWHIAQHLRAVPAARVRIVNTNDLPRGWDLADA